MRNYKKPLPDSIVTTLRKLPAIVFCAFRVEDEGITAVLDVGPDRIVGDACPMGYRGATAYEAAEHMKAWLMDDLSCQGKLGKIQYQPHWSEYDILYRLGKYWQERANNIAALTAEIEALERSRTKEKPKYQGWENSATFLAHLYISQEAVLVEKIEALPKVTVGALKKLLRIKFAASDAVKVGFQKGVIYLDSWAEGLINWKELALNLQSDTVLRKTVATD